MGNTKVSKNSSADSMMIAGIVKLEQSKLLIVTCHQLNSY